MGKERESYQGEVEPGMTSAELRRLLYERIDGIDDPEKLARVWTFVKEGEVLDQEEEMVEDLITEGLCSIEHVMCDHPVVNEIREVRNSMEERMAYLGPLPSSATTRFNLKKMPEETMSVLLNQLIGDVEGIGEGKVPDVLQDAEGWPEWRIAALGRYFKTVDGVDTASDLLAGKIPGPWVMHFSEDLWLWNYVKTQGNKPFRYVSRAFSAIFREAKPDERAILGQLVEQGNLPAVFSDYHYLIAQHRRYNMPSALFWSHKALGILSGLIPSVGAAFSVLRPVVRGFLPAAYYFVEQRVNPNPLATELEALRSKFSSPSAPVRVAMSSGAIPEMALRDLDKHPENHWIEAAKLHELVQGMQLLGVEAESLKKLVNAARFDKEAMTFPALENALTSRIRGLGISDVDQQAFLKALFAKSDLDRFLSQRAMQEYARIKLEQAADRY